MGEIAFARRVLIAGLLSLILLALAALLARHPEVPLLLFGGILGAILLDALARPLCRGLGVPHSLAVLGVASLGVAAVAVGIWLMGPRLYAQGTQLADRLPELLAGLERRTPPALRDIGLEIRLPTDGAGWSRLAPYVFGSLGGFFSSSVGAFTAALAGSALSIFLALAPEAYRDGALLLVPRSRRPRLHEVLGAMGHALRWWLVGRIIAMAIVALLTAVGLVLLDVPQALSLAVIAGLLTFIPYVGPLLAALPAVLLALADSFQLALIVAALYTAIQLLENYVVTPVVQGRTVAIQPAWLLIAQIALGVLLGGLGLVLATPVAVAGIVCVQMLYVQDVLGEPVQVLGQPDTVTRRRSTMHATLAVFSACAVALLSAGVSSAGSSADTQASLRDRQGKDLGSVQVRAAASGLLVDLDLHDLPTGTHAFHIHQTGRCEPPFETAGSHLEPNGRHHGFFSPEGPHAGDFVNLEVGRDGRIRQTLRAPDVTLAELRDSDGSAFVLHAGPDDYESQPAGNSGDRIACARIAPDANVTTR